MNKSWRNIMLFLLVFFSLWILRQFVYIYVDETLPGLLKTLFGIFVKFLIWGGCIFVFSNLVYKENFFHSFKFENNKKGVKYAIWFLTILLGFNLLVNLFSGTSLIHNTLSFRGVLSAVIAAPIIEELMFRGFILKKLSSSMKFLYANLLTAILFMFIHFPGWLI